MIIEKSCAYFISSYYKVRELIIAAPVVKIFPTAAAPLMVKKNPKTVSG